MSTFLLFGGAGALGKVLTKRILYTGNKVVVFSRDEAKHSNLKLEFSGYPLFSCVGDIRNKESVRKAILSYKPEFIINCAALKQIEVGEAHPTEVIQTNTIGTQNICDVILEQDVACNFLFISTDKACEPITSYGCTKFLAERIVLNAAQLSQQVKLKANFIIARYGNVLDSTGSVIPLFRKKLEKNECLPVTHQEMTRFLMSLDDAVDLIEKALFGNNGMIFIPKLKSAKIIDIAHIMLEEHQKNINNIDIIGLRGKEKMHEKLISDDELKRTLVDHATEPYQIYADQSINFDMLKQPYTSDKVLMTKEELRKFLKEKHVI